MGNFKMSKSRGLTFYTLFFSYVAVCFDTILCLKLWV